MNRLSQQEFKEAPKVPVVIVLDNIRSQNNTGSVFRTADAFRLEAVFLCGITATPPHREITKTALGATESVTWKYFSDSSDALKLLKSEGYTLLGIELTHESISLNSFHPEKGRKYALVFGNEVYGIEDRILSMLDGCIEIPQYGTKHSLNVSVAAGIVIWHTFSELGDFLLT